MKHTEAQALARLTGQAARGVTALAQDTQNAVMDEAYGRATALLGPAVTPLHTIHRALTQHAYFWVHAGLEAAARIAGLVTAAVANGSGSIADRPRAHGALAVLNGITGDHLHRHRSALALPMTLRHVGRDVAADAPSLRAAYGSDHARLAVFVHGLLETEDAWRYRSLERWGTIGTSYGTRLRDELGYLPLWVRYNTGLSLAANSAALSRLLGEVVDAWPGTVDEVVLVGHSMGGLVILGALERGAETRSLPVRAAVTLGSPREGAPLARQADAVEVMARTVAPARWLSGVLGLRSAGIRDLHDGIRPGLAMPSSVGQYAVLSTITPRPTSLVGARIGDGLVPVPARHTVETAVLGGLHHLDLLNHPRVYDQLTDWLAEPVA
ncbi:MAG: esterase/lipase family protein [Dermatophilaceae bacterium]